MNLLAFDTSTETLSIAVQCGDRAYAHSGPGGAQASATLITAVRSLLDEAGLELGQLDALVFGRGPGSFTGLRTACAVAHGCSNVVAVLDARMDEVYMAHYQWQSGTWQNSGAPALSAPEDVQVPPGWTVAGNAQAAYGERLAPDSHHVHALPTATALLRLAPVLISAGLAVPAADALPLYIRDKVARTTAERAAAPSALVTPA